MGDSIFGDRAGDMPLSRPDGVAQGTEFLDLHFEDIARLHEDWWQFDQRWDTENEQVRARILHHAAIQSALDVQPAGPWRHGIRRHQPRPERSRSIEILAHRPLRCPELKITHAR